MRFSLPAARGVISCTQACKCCSILGYYKYKVSRKEIVMGGIKFQLF